MSGTVSQSNGAVSLDSFVREYSSAPADKQVAALVAAMAVLAGRQPPAGTETPLTQRELANRYGLHEVTIWRWQFPYENWAGIKRYKPSVCDSYLKSDALILRRKILNAERQVKNSKQSKRKEKYHVKKATHR